ncbi:MAG: tetratricopeptide repeat protein [Acidobacteriia bacterium]|nr:tetratricopeptide repeat protein [Terriglobia bacterium]
MRSFFVLFFTGICLCLLPAPAGAQTAASRTISGQVVLSGGPAPAGFSVLLTIVTSENAVPRAQTPVARAVTDADGRFMFDHLEEVGGNAGREVFALIGHFPAHKDGVVFVDLRQQASGNVTLTLEPDREVDAPAPRVEASVRKTADEPANTRSNGRQLASPEAREAFARARESLFGRHDPEGSLKDLKQVTKSDPWFGPGYLLMGLADMQLQRWSDAQWAFEEVTKVEPANAEGYLGVGSALNEQKSWAAAQKALEECLGLRTDYAEAHYELARSLSGLGKLEDAVAHAQRAVEINDDYASPHALMGNIYLQMEEPEAALKEFQEYLRIEPQGSLAPEAKEMIGKLKKLLEEK